ncbi:chitobiase/beta-hexosaminidase C-terminal domain-containing protein [Candidatus Methanomassiliicoccus intestinalis]|uniref:chitobiase/beta-hexosaminidase C-terminal domain-containing protein n=1 Tax=Candidatus Methanomassiliicoccus intestinalis TaxID=1406512 RepID=UPI0037DCB99F
MELLYSNTEGKRILTVLNDQGTTTGAGLYDDTTFTAAIAAVHSGGQEFRGWDIQSVTGVDGIPATVSPNDQDVATVTFNDSTWVCVVTGSAAKPPIFSLAGGNYVSAQRVTISSDTEGAEIYYTVDGSIPSLNSIRYTGEIKIPSSVTINAFAVKGGVMESKIVSVTYIIEKTAPVVIQHPSDQIVVEGQTATFSVIATGYPEPTYQWLVGRFWGTAQPIPGATESTYTIPVTDLSMNETPRYLCMITNSEGVTYSNKAYLTVRAPSAYQVIEGANSEWTLGGSEDLNFKADGDFTKFIEIMVDDVKLNNTAYTVQTGTIVTLNVAYLQTLNIGTHVLKVIYEDGNAETLFTVKAAPVVTTDYTITATAGIGGTISPTGVTTIESGKDVVFNITADDGYQIKDVVIDGISVGKTNNYAIMNVSSNHTIDAEFELYTVPPTGEITIGDNKWTQFSDEITFDLFFKDTQEVTISAQDSSGDVVIQYYIHHGENPLIIDNLMNLDESEWTDYNNTKLSISSDDKLVIYVKLTNKTGNSTYISSNGLVFDSETPTLQGATNNQRYTTVKTISVSDAHLKSVLLNNEELLSTDNTLTSKEIILSDNGTHIIKATDKAGNEAEITVIINIPTLKKIETPLAIIDVANGTMLENILLPEYVQVQTTIGQKQAAILWDFSTANPAYDPTKKDEQTFTLTGTVSLPDGVTNKNDLPLTVNLSITVKAEVAVSLSTINIVAEPSKLDYLAGEALDLTGLSVKLIYSDGRSETVELAKFSEKGITVSLAEGSVLVSTDESITVYAGGKSAKFTINVNSALPTQVTTPVFFPASGTYDGKQIVEITCATEDAVIYYTTDETEPTTDSTKYLGVITVEKNTILKAIAVKGGMDNSAVASAEYVINYQITAIAEEGGSIDPAGEVTVESGKDQTFTITSNNGYKIKDVKIDGRSVGKVSIYKFENVNANHTIVVEFERNNGGEPSTPPVNPPVNPPVDPDPEPIKPDENGNAEIKVDEKKAEELINNAVSSGSAAVELVDTNNIEGELTSVTVSIADLQTILDKLENNENVNSVSIATSIGTIVVEQEVLADILESTDAETVSFAVNDAKDKLTEEQKQAVGNNPVFEINIHADDQKVTSFNGKTITISLPYELKDGEDPNNIVIYHLKDDGTVEKMNGYYDKESKQFIFKTNHLSMFFIAYEAAEPVTPDQPDDNKNDNIIYYAIAAIVVIILIIALAYYILQKKQ